MKNKMLISLLTVVIAIAAYAVNEDVITVTFVNGDKTEYKTSEIKEVTFSDDQMVIIDNHGAKEYNVVDIVKVGRRDPRVVDLGLSVRWASMNVGAKRPSDYGDYFAWGETMSKSYYDSHSKWDKAPYSYLKSEGVIDSQGNLTPEFDAATANWGSEWRMPTFAEIQELLNKCTWTWTTQDGHNGHKVTGPNGNSIFLPAAGYRNAYDLYGAGTTGNYWSAYSYDRASSYLYISSTFNYCWNDYNPRYYGQSVRPVTE